MLRSVTFILENRNSEAAGSRDARHFNNDNGPRALVCRKLGGEAGLFGAAYLPWSEK